LATSTPRAIHCSTRRKNKRIVHQNDQQVLCRMLRVHFTNNVFPEHEKISIVAGPPRPCAVGFCDSRKHTHPNLFCPFRVSTLYNVPFLFAISQCASRYIAAVAVIDEEFPRTSFQSRGWNWDCTNALGTRRCATQKNGRGGGSGIISGRRWSSSVMRRLVQSSVFVRHGRSCVRLRFVP